MKKNEQDSLNKKKVCTSIAHIRSVINDTEKYDDDDARTWFWIVAAAVCNGKRDDIKPIIPILLKIIKEVRPEAHDAILRKAEQECPGLIF